MCFILVWFCDVISYTLLVPPAIMGLAVLGVGLQLSDLASSLGSAKVAKLTSESGAYLATNSMSANIFALLFGLGVPWTIKSAYYQGKDVNRVFFSSWDSVALVIMLLILCVTFSINAVHFAKWRMRKLLGLGLILFYIGFLTLSVLGILDVI